MKGKEGRNYTFPTSALDGNEYQLEAPADSITRYPLEFEQIPTRFGTSWWG